MLFIHGDFGQLPTLAGYQRAIASSNPYFAPGPDGIGPGVHRQAHAISLAVSQHFALGIKQRLCLRAPIQNRGGALFAIWKISSVGYFGMRCALRKLAGQF